MIESILKGFEVWTDAQGVKSKGKVKSVDNISLDGIAKLRELILGLAIRGKLVPQDINEQPVSELIKTIDLERDELINEGKLKKQNTYPAIKDDEIPFALPNGWEFVRFGNVTFNRDSERIPLSVEERSGRKGEFEYYGASGIIDKIDNYLFDKPLLLIGEDGANLVNRSTPIAFIARGKYWVNNHAHVIDGISEEFLSFICLYINAISLLDYITGTAQPKMNQTKMNSIVLALPPLPEQIRIIAKVNELMALCDKLEEQQTSNLTTHHYLVKSLLETLTNAADADELQTAWEKLSEHFDTLFCTEDSIEQLKQTIFQLAIMGRLVKQDPNDEPASELIKRIKTDKERLIKEGTISKQKELSPITEDDIPYKLPNSWIWCRLGNVTDIISGASFQSGDFNNTGGVKCIKITNAGVGEFVETEDYLPESFGEKYKNYLIKEGDLILALTRPYISSGLKISICPSSYNNSLLNQRVAAIRSVSSILSQLYVYAFIQSPHVLSHYKSKFDDKSQQPNMKMNDITDLAIALPPAYEQKRILAKIEHLLSICDLLQMKVSKSENIKNVLANTLIEIFS